MHAYKSFWVLKMRLTDLEFYRWRFQNNFHLTSRQKHCNMSWLEYWQEYGAFTSILPRQVGKSTMLKNMVDFLVSREENDIWIVCNNLKAADHLVYNIGIHKYMVFVNMHASCKMITEKTSGVHLFMDEFLYTDGWEDFLKRPWKSVTLISTLKGS